MNSFPCAAVRVFHRLLCPKYCRISRGLVPQQSDLVKESEKDKSIGRIRLPFLDPNAVKNANFGHEFQTKMLNFMKLNNNTTINPINPPFVRHFHNIFSFAFLSVPFQMAKSPKSIEWHTIKFPTPAFVSLFCYEKKTASNDPTIIKIIQKFDSRNGGSIFALKFEGILGKNFDHF